MVETCKFLVIMIIESCGTSHADNLIDESLAFSVMLMFRHQLYTFEDVLAFFSPHQHMGCDDLQINHRSLDMSSVCVSV